MGCLFTAYIVITGPLLYVSCLLDRYVTLCVYWTVSLLFVFTGLFPYSVDWTVSLLCVLTGLFPYYVLTGLFAYCLC